MLDIYISRKKRLRSKLLFDFVRFGERNRATVAIRNLNGRLLDGEKLFFKRARFEKKPVSRQGTNSKVLRNTS